MRIGQRGDYMEDLTKTVLIIAELAIGVPLVVILFGWAINVIHIMWVVGEKFEQFIGEKIDKKIYDSQKRLRKEIDGD